MNESDPMLRSDACITETRIKVVNPLRKVLLAGPDGVYRLVGDVDPGAPWLWRKDRYRRDTTDAVLCLASGPGAKLVAGGFAGGAGLEISRDQGKTWAPAPGWPAGRAATAVAIPGAGQIYVGGAPPAIWRGDADGGGFIEAPLAPGEPWPAGARARVISQCALRPGNWLVTAEPGGVLASQDGGRTWTRALGDRLVTGGVFTRGGVAVVSTDAGVMRSEDGGLTWTRPAGPIGEAADVTVDTAGTVIASFTGHPEQSLFASRDKGLSWEPFGPDREMLPLPPEAPWKVAADSAHPDAVYVVAGGVAVLVGLDSARKLAEGLPEIAGILVL